MVGGCSQYFTGKAKPKSSKNVNRSKNLRSYEYQYKTAGENEKNKLGVVFSFNSCFLSIVQNS